MESGMPNIASDRVIKKWLWGFAALTLLSLFSAILLKEEMLMLAPAVVLIVTAAILDFRKIYLFLFFSLPLSIHYTFSNGMSVDLPAEPLMVGLLLVIVIYLLIRPDALENGFWKHPLILLVLAQIVWAAFLLMYSVAFIYSFKFLLAKLWYVGVFLFMGGVILKRPVDFKPVFWAVFIPLVILTVITIARHAAYGFEFDLVNRTVTPYFKNHVSYAAMLTLVLPFVWYARKWYAEGSWTRMVINAGLLIMLAGIYFSYTRGAWLAVGAMIAIQWIIRWRLLKITALGGGLVLAAVITFFLWNNRYLNFSPDYEKTIYHKSLSGHLEATIAMSDVSSAERVYRWIAAWYMFRDRPLTGFGPGNFYPYYKAYTVNDFRTYVSDNKEKSTVHNYLLLMLVEQGLPGFLLFFVLLVAMFFYGEKIYRLSSDPVLQQWILAVILCLTAIFVQTMLSDLIETPKVGPFFFTCLAILVNCHLQLKRALKPTA